MSEFSAYQIIDQKKRGQKLSSSQIQWFINGLQQGEVQDYQASALLMAIYLNGMDPEETYHLTNCMMNSGKTLHFSGQHFIDKHSTGGIGDKTSFILAPIAAACGVKVPMMAGRGLGFTGGTVDKVESIPGFQTEISLKRFTQLVRKNGLALIGQTQEIAPADKKLYALRDVTATIESVPLITASILSKKLAEGTQGIVMDIKVGSGAFMKTSKEATELAQSLLKTSKLFKRKMITVLSNMDQPLGQSIGHSVEIIECVEILKGHLQSDLSELSIVLAAHMIHMAQKADSFAKAKKMAIQSIQDGSALQKFELMIKAQGGKTHFINDYKKLPIAKKKTILRASQSGYLTKIDSRLLGETLIALGGGRVQTSSKLDLSVGLEVLCKTNQPVKKNQALLEIIHHSKQQALVNKLSQTLKKRLFTISTRAVPATPLILKTLKQR